MKNARIKLLTFIMMLTMLVYGFVFPSNALVTNIVGRDSNKGPITCGELGEDEDIGPATKYSNWAGSSISIDGIKDSSYGTETMVEANFWSMDNYSASDKTKSKLGSDFFVWYANDEEYLYAYADVTFPSTKKQTGVGDIFRYYIDFYNRHDNMYYEIDNDYMDTYLPNNSTTALANGGEFSYNIHTEEAEPMRRGANNLYDSFDIVYKFSDGTSSTTNNFSKDVDGYAIEVRIKLPDYIKNSIFLKENPIISIGYEIRNQYENQQPNYKMTFYEPETWNTKKGEISSFCWGDYTVNPDVVLACVEINRVPADVRGNTMTLDGVKGAKEGWSSFCFSYMSSKTYNNNPDHDVPEIYLAADSDNLYVYGDGKTPIYRVWMILQIDPAHNRDTTSGGEDKFLDLRLFGTSRTYNPEVHKSQDPDLDGLALNCNGVTNSNYTGKNYAFSGATHAFNNDMSAFELKIPMSDYMKELIKKGGSFDIGFIIATGNDDDRFQDCYYKYNWSNGTIPVKIPVRYLSSLTVDAITIKGFQSRRSVSADTKDPTADIRFVATLAEEDISLYKNIGFEVTCNGKTVSQNSRYVYRQLNAGKETIVAGEGDYVNAAYFVCYTIPELEEGDYFITFRIYCTRKDDNITRYSDQAQLAFSVDNDGEITKIFDHLKKYAIVISQNADINEQTLAKNLREYMFDFYSYRSPIKTDVEEKSEYEILVGNTSRTNIEANKNCYTVSVDKKTIQFIANGMLGYENLTKYLKGILSGLDTSADQVFKEGYYYESGVDTSLDDGTHFITNKYGDVRIMLYNVYGYSSSGPIEKRQQYQIEILKAYMPDVFGAQEYSWNYTPSMTRLLDNIGYTQVPVECSSENNFTPLFYNAKTVNYIDGGYRLYRLKNDQGIDINDVKSKSLTWAVFEVKTGANAGKKFAVISTHFMYRSNELTADQANEARCIDAREMLETIADIQREYGQIPLIAGGDLNCKLKDDPCKILTDAGLLVAQKQATVKNDNEGHHGYAEYNKSIEHYKVVYVPKSNYEVGSIDHIFVNSGTKVEAFGTLINDYTLYSSDHSPIMADISF